MAAEIDKLCELSEYLIHYVFSFLNTTDVVKTCILSKRWTFMLASCPFLTFTFCPTKSRTNETSYINFVQQVIFRRGCVPITNFVFNSYVDAEVGVIQSWVCYAIKHKVQHLTLQLICRQMSFELPDSFYYQGVKRISVMAVEINKLRELPEYLIHYVFSFLDTINVVKTCIFVQKMDAPVGFLSVSYFHFLSN
ncbi:putative F-box/LRR-repeat protein At3g58880 [Mercurialis annua]|uniref:putative F-box/LRR-repeat protein At3g58880 n=1 Tax=Mercurialis annua TaxID=3986 RepID=UPI00215E3C8B|nr:putative F-box/LRR-repeat protein At3g58880 [Mercurialis annua]